MPPKNDFICADRTGKGRLYTVKRKKTVPRLGKLIEEEVVMCVIVSVSILSFILEEERVDEVENVTKSVVLKESIGTVSLSAPNVNSTDNQP